MTLADDLARLRLEHSNFSAEIEDYIRKTFLKNYLKRLDEQFLETKELNNIINDLVFQRYETTLDRYIPWISKVFDLSGREIIEIGCGTGCSTAAFAHFVKHIHAYEISEISVLAAQARMKIMGINNVSIIHSNPDNLLETLKLNHYSGVSVVLLFAVLEHMTVQERLKTLKIAWDLLLPDGILIVAETPNRLTYFDHHTSWLPFFHFLPLDLALKYYEKSPRNLFKLAVKEQLEVGEYGDERDTLIRWGTAVSYHEFELVLGSNLKDLIVADGDAEEMRSLYPLSTEEKLLQQYFIEKNIDQPLAFTNQIFNLIFQKKDAPKKYQLRSTNISSRAVSQLDNFEISFKQGVLEESPSSIKKVALLVTPEYEDIFRNGGIGTYYCTLSERLAAEDFYVILLLCQSQETFAGKSMIPGLKHMFLTRECQDILELQPTHLAILSQLQEWEWVEYENYCALFFAQAIATTFPDAYIYIEFPEMLGLGYRTVQAKRSGVLGENCVVAVTLHSGQEWLGEAQAQYTQPNPQWHWQTSHYEQYSFEHADLAFFLSQSLKQKVEEYGWKTDHAVHSPSCFPVSNLLLETASIEDSSQKLVDDPRQWILGMTSIEEQTFLEEYARNEYSGKGEIVELGCWLGSASISLAKGLTANSHITEKSQRIHAYDSFIWVCSMELAVIGSSLEGKYENGDSFFDEYSERIRSWSQFIQVYPGDLTEIGWDQGAIEFLFIDAMKSWSLAASIVKDFFPQLVPDISLVVHQDFAHHYTSWIHLIIYRLREYFSPVEISWLYPSKAFRYIKPISNEVLQNSCAFDTFSKAEVEAAFDYSLFS